MEEIEINKEIKKLREDFEIEKANLRANYFLSIFIIFTYIFIEQIGEIEIYGYKLSTVESFSIITLCFVLFYIKDLIKYSQFIVKKYIFRIQK